MREIPYSEFRSNTLVYICVTQLLLGMRYKWVFFFVEEQDVKVNMVKKLKR